MPSDQQDTALGQGDIAVNLFAILLIVFVLMDLSARQEAIDGFPLRTLPMAETETPMGAVAGWRPIQPVRARFYVWQGVLYRISPNALAQHFADGPDQIGQAPGMVNRSTPIAADPDPSAYQVDIYHADTLPPGLVLYQVGLDDLAMGLRPDRLVADLNTMVAADVFVPRSQLDDALGILSVLAAARRPSELKILDAAGRFSYQRRSSQQGFEATFK